MAADRSTRTPNKQHLPYDMTTPPLINSTIRAIYRSVTCGGDNGNDEQHHMLLKVVYDSDRVRNDEETVLLPIVLFLSGADCPHESYMWLASRLAYEGCCVMLSSCVVPILLFGQRTQTTVRRLFSVPYNPSMLASLSEYKKGPSSEGITALLEEVRSMSSQEQDSPLYNKLDFSRFVIGGHSAGGRTALDLVAFDNPFDISAVFTYGASLVGGGLLPFVEKGSIMACDNVSPPPLLFMGGSHDGVTAQASSTKTDAMEPLRRTMDELALVNAKGDVDFVIFNGANHMVMCSPIDVTCPAVIYDWPLLQLREDAPWNNDNDDDDNNDSSVATSHYIRHVMGETICDFLRHRVGLFHTNRNGTTSNNNDHMDDDDDDQWSKSHWSPRIYQPSLYHTVESFRAT